LKQKKDFYSYEVESWQLYLLKNDISCMEGLQYLGIDVIAGVKYTYESADGVREERMYFPEDFIIFPVPEQEIRGRNHTLPPGMFIDFPCRDY